MEPNRFSHGTVVPRWFMIGPAINLPNAGGVVRAIALGTARCNLLNRNALLGMYGSGRIIRIFAGGAVAARTLLLRCGDLRLIAWFRLRMLRWSSRIRVRHLSRRLRGSGSQTGGTTAYLGIGIAGSLSGCGGVRLGNFALFAARCGLGNRCGLGPAGGFDALGSGSASCLLRFAQRVLDEGLRRLAGLLAPSSLYGLARGQLGRSRSLFGLRLRQQSLFTDLLGGTMPQLRAILATRG
jgi:hypothetical protein